MAITVEYDVVVRERQPIQDGLYRHVATAYPLRGGPSERIWWDGEGGVVHEGEARADYPFQVVYIDFDGTVVRSEERGGFFDAAWAAFLRRAGLSGSDDVLNALRSRVYRWRDDVGTSTADMLNRIERGIDVYGSPLMSEDQNKLSKLFGFSDGFEDRASVIAEIKESIGAQMIKEDPRRVLELAPLSPGFPEFLHAIPPEVPVAIGSASRRRTIIDPILDAHDAITPGLHLRERFGGFMFGEEDVGRSRKPDRLFFERVAINTGRVLHREGRIPSGGIGVEDMVYIGDRGDIDVPSSRRMPHVIVSPRPIGPLGRLTATVPDFPTLLEIAQNPEQIENTTLQRLARTLRVSRVCP